MTAWADEDGYLVAPLPPYYDKSAGHWACRCELYKALGHCAHLIRWRPQVTVRALECYL